MKSYQEDKIDAIMGPFPQAAQGTNAFCDPSIPDRLQICDFTKELKYTNEKNIDPKTIDNPDSLIRYK